MALILANELKRKLLISRRTTVCSARRLLCLTNGSWGSHDGANKAAPTINRRGDGEELPLKREVR